MQIDRDINEDTALNSFGLLEARLKDDFLTKLN